MDTEMIITLGIGAMAGLGILTSLLKVLSEFHKFLSGLIAAANDGQVTSDEFRQAAKDWADVTSAGIGAWKSALAIFRR